MGRPEYIYFVKLLRYFFFILSSHYIELT